MSYTVYIDGAAGTTGLQIERRLAQRADIALLTLPEENRKSLPHRLEAISRADASVLCLPDDAAAEIVAAAPAGAKICDASTAHRTKPGWVYGFPELGGRRRNIKRALRVAVPGCYASGFLALATPLVQCGALPAAAALCASGISGYSGGGKNMIAAYEANARPPEYEAPRAYALSMAHKHLPEMQAVAGLLHAPAFCPVVCNYYSGMLVSLPLSAETLCANFQSTEALVALYRDYYAGEALIHIKTAEDAPEDGMLSANAMAGRDDMEIFILGNNQHPLLCARFDNLGKGAAGAAVQCLNLVLGAEEATGLRLP